MQAWIDSCNEADKKNPYAGAKPATPLDFALIVYRGRQAKDRKDRVYPPHGVKVGGDKKYAGARQAIWYPTPHEVRPCCWGVAPPNVLYPWVYQRHCRTARHVAMLFNVDERDIVRATSKRREQKRCSSCKRFISSILEECGPCMYRERVDSETA